MSLSWTPFLNGFFSCLLLALLFSCHSLVRVSSLLLGNALFTRCGSALLSSITSFWMLVHHGILDLKLLCLIVDNPLSSLSFSPASSNLAMFAQTVGFSWSCVAPRRRCASARSSTCCATSPRAPHTPELVCSGSSLLSKQLQHCLSHTRRLFRFSALSAPLCGSLQRRTRGLPVWHLRHHCVVVGLR